MIPITTVVVVEKAFGVQLVIYFFLYVCVFI